MGHRLSLIMGDDEEEWWRYDAQSVMRMGLGFEGLR